MGRAIVPLSNLLLTLQTFCTSSLRLVSFAQRLRRLDSRPVLERAFNSALKALQSSRDAWLLIDPSLSLHTSLSRPSARDVEHSQKKGELIRFEDSQYLADSLGPPDGQVR